MKKYSIAAFLTLMIFPLMLEAKECNIEDKDCLLSRVLEIAEEIDNKSWRDQTYRELAKAYAYQNELGKAIDILGRIETPDTQAMTIRGIGMAAASNNLDQRTYNTLFQDLTKQAETISHAPSRGIAMTYIAMAQAFAGDNDGAKKTAQGMNNIALRNKAFGESAEIQAEKGNFEAAMDSIKQIEASSFKNKAYATISKILLEKKMIEQAYQSALMIDNPYQKAASLQAIINHDNPEENIK